MYSVYEIENIINGKKYVGITSRHIDERFEDHKSRARCYKRGNRLYAAMRKHGVDNFNVSLLDRTSDEDEVRLLETRYIKEKDSYANGYNCNLGGHGTLHVTDEVKRKISLANSGRKHSEESRKNMSDGKRGNSYSAANFGAFTNKGSDSPLSKTYRIQFPDGTINIVKGLRAFCRKHSLATCKLYGKGKTKGFILLDRLNDYRKPA